MKKELSIKYQKRRDLIGSEYRHGQGAILGKRYPNPETGKPISRQRVNQIKNDYLKKQTIRWWQFWRK